MAKAINNIEKIQTDELELQGQAIQELLGNIADNKQDLMILLDILKEIRSTGLLDILEGLLKTREEVTMIALEQMNQPSMHRTIQNLTSLAKFLGKIDPNQLNKLLTGIAHGIDKTTESGSDYKSAGIWGLTKNLRDSDVNSTLQTAIVFMKGMGEGLRKDESPPSVH